MFTITLSHEMVLLKKPFILEIIEWVNNAVILFQKKSSQNLQDPMLGRSGLKTLLYMF